jgi:RNA polymerase sigma-70 factor, ECF subfamily
MLRSQMSAELQSGADAQAEYARTLGDVLYGADFQQRIPETEWVGMIRAIAGGDTSALGSLYMMMHGIVFTLVVRITGSRSVAEEVIIDLFHDIWRIAKDYDPGRESVVAWIMNLARDRALAHQRPVQTERVALMREAVNSLSTEERQAIEATFHAGATSAEVASRVGKTSAEVEARLRVALDKLAGVLAPGDMER